MTSSSGRWRSARVSWVLGAFAALLRLGFVLGVHSPADRVLSDMWVYDHRARNLLSGTLTAWDSFTPCGYPWLLSVVYRAFPQGGADAVGLLQALLGGASVALTHRIGLRLSASGVTATVAAALVAVHSPLILYTGLLLTETLSAFLILLTTLSLLRAIERRDPGEWMWAGLCLGVGTVVRPNLLPFYPLLALWLWLGLGRRRGTVALLLVALGSLPVVAASAAHNSRLVGKPSLLGTNGGLNFYLNFSDVRTIRYRDHMNDHAITPLPSLLRYTRDERAEVPFYDDAYYYRLGLARIAQEPLRLLRALRNLPEAAGLGPLSYWPGLRGFDPWLERSSRAFFYLVVAPCLGWLLWLAVSTRLCKPEHFARQLLAAWLASGALVAWLFLADPRIRVPFDPLWILLALDGIAAATRRLRRRSAL